MKILQLTFIMSFAALLFAGSCKKKDTVEPKPTDYNSLSFKYIKDKESAMATNEITAVQTDGTISIPTGTVFVYKTTEGLFGKFKIINYGAEPHRNLTISLVTYNADGTVKVSKDNLVIKSTYTADLDTGVEIGAGGDLWWRSSGYYKLAPESGAKIVQYTF